MKYLTDDLQMRKTKGSSENMKKTKSKKTVEVRALETTKKEVTDVEEEAKVLPGH